MTKITCPHCGYQYESRTKEPKRCPACQKWMKERPSVSPTTAPTTPTSVTTGTEGCRTVKAQLGSIEVQVPWFPETEPDGPPFSRIQKCLLDAGASPPQDPDAPKGYSTENVDRVRKLKKEGKL